MKNFNPKTIMMGPAGADGAEGRTGAAGADGTAGAEGRAGAAGAAGADGAAGRAGSAGADGADGKNGARGARGAMGMHPNRWSLAFFFALVAFPFVSVWYTTQAARVADALMPIYTIASVGDIEQTPTGLIFHKVTFDKHFSCKPNGVLYVSAPYRDGVVDGEILIPAERGDGGKPFFIHSALYAGESVTVPDVRIVTAREMLDRVDSVRFVIPCERPFLGPTRAYTNPVKIH